jgi:translation initiation factor IF-3
MINERVAYKFRDIRVIGADGSQIGIIQSRQALQMAKDQGLDLVMVSPTAQPPVCRIVDYGRHKYETERRDRENKKKQLEVKGIKIGPHIGEHDIQFLIKNATRFLEEGHKVKVTCQFRARAVTHPEVGKAKLDRFAADVAHISVIEKPAAMEGKLMIMILTPKPGIRKTATKPGEKSDERPEDGEASESGSAPEIEESAPPEESVPAPE